MFPEEKYLHKIIGEIIKLFNMPPYQKTNLKRMNNTSRVSTKKAIKKIGRAQIKTDIASSQGYSTREILRYDHDEC